LNKTILKWIENGIFIKIPQFSIENHRIRRKKKKKIVLRNIKENSRRKGIV
jgi:hypothetical protein